MLIQEYGEIIMLFRPTILDFLWCFEIDRLSQYGDVLKSKLLKNPGAL